MTRLSDALARLETALVSVGHPLGDPSNRPPGRPPAEIERRAADLLGIELPAELIEIWAWCGGNTAEYRIRLGPFNDILPGDIRIETLEAAITAVESQPPELTSQESASWLPVFYQGDNVIAHWCEIDHADNGAVPLTINYRENVPDQDPIWRFGSISELIEAMATLTEDGHWIADPHWQYTGGDPNTQWIG